MAASGPNAAELDEAFTLAAEHEAAQEQQAEAIAPAKPSKSKKSKINKLKQKLLPGQSKDESPTAGPSTQPAPEEVYTKVKDEVERRHGAGVAAQFTPEMAADLMAKMKAGTLNMPAAPDKKTMKDYKFWSTQPVAKLGEEIKEEGAIEGDKKPDEIKADPYPLPDNFEWDTVDLTDEAQLKEVYELLTQHYVEDTDASFRFDYSADFFKWALKPPGFIKDWHIGVRVTTTRKLVGFISGIPMDLRVRNSEKHCSEINFLCVHKKLRAKRLAPVLIKEVTRRCHLAGIFQAIYTAGVYLPTPISQCQYFHRALDVKKLVELGFSGVPRFKTLAGMIKEAALPEVTAVVGLREMEERDGPAVARLLRKYMARFDVAPVFSDAEVLHNFTSGRGEGPSERHRRKGQVVWSYVVEDPANHEITDFFSFVYLPSTAIKHRRTIEAAYLYYYASTAAFPDSTEVTNWAAATEDARAVLGARLNVLMRDALIVAKLAGFDVFNALTLMDNSLFVYKQKFGEGDGRLNYYLYNWLAKPIDGGTIGTTAAALSAMQAQGSLEGVELGGQRECGSGVGVVML